MHVEKAAIANVIWENYYANDWVAHTLIKVMSKPAITGSRNCF